MISLLPKFMFYLNTHKNTNSEMAKCDKYKCIMWLKYSFTSNMYFMHINGARPSSKNGRKNTYGDFGQVSVHAARMLPAPIRSLYE